MAALLRGSLPLERYVILGRGLHAVYEGLEEALQRCRAHPLAAWLDRPELARAGHIDRDLRSLHGPAWRDEVALLGAGAEYAAAVHRLASDDPHGVIAHAWVRYMGDVSGGQTLARLVRTHYGLEGTEGTAAYDFAELGPIDAFKAEFRDRLDALPPGVADAMTEEARRGFHLSIALMDAVLPATDPV